MVKPQSQPPSVHLAKGFHLRCWQAFQLTTEVRLRSPDPVEFDSNFPSPCKDCLQVFEEHNVREQEAKRYMSFMVIHYSLCKTRHQPLLVFDTVEEYKADDGPFTGRDVFSVIRLPLKATFDYESYFPCFSYVISRNEHWREDNMQRWYIDSDVVEYHWRAVVDFKHWMVSRHPEKVLSASDNPSLFWKPSGLKFPTVCPLVFVMFACRIYSFNVRYFARCLFEAGFSPRLVVFYCCHPGYVLLLNRLWTNDAFLQKCTSLSSADFEDFEKEDGHIFTWWSQNDDEKYEPDMIELSLDHYGAASPEVKSVIEGSILKLHPDLPEPYHGITEKMVMDFLPTASFPYVC